MDDTLCDFTGAFNAAIEAVPSQKFPQAQMDFFRKLKPLSSAIFAMHTLAKEYDVWIATRPSYLNPLCYTEKRLWVQDHLGIDWCERLIIIPDKGLLKGDWLIDDKEWPGFEGNQLLFGSPWIGDNLDAIGLTNGVDVNWENILKFFTDKEY